MHNNVLPHLGSAASLIVWIQVKELDQAHYRNNQFYKRKEYPTRRDLTQGHAETSFPLAYAQIIEDGEGGGGTQIYPDL